MSEREEKWTALQARLGHRFHAQDLLFTALRHRSAGEGHNERLEFLGDAALDLAVAELLYRRHPDEPEGTLSRARASLVRQETLAAAALRLGLDEYLVIGEGERRVGGNRRPSLLADALEAIVGAVLLDGGYEAARELVARILEPELAALGPLERLKDPKTRLQEWLQGRHHPVPRYEIVSVSGPAHAQHFKVRAQAEAIGLSAEGEGPSRRAAEQDAAAKILAQLGET
ncbi:MULTISPECIES: ribonuclease III [Tepidiphilus]|uniref:ribonuclease III n=1 Tax=Tepidiphilus TaxID=203470 RepID=UPI00115F655D|nr:MULTISPECIES: ribonuclease III [Tepidiphilus]